MTKKHFRVVWAVDATHGDKEIQMKTARVLRALLRDLDAEVEPVTVLSPDQLLLPAVFQEHLDQYRSEAEKLLVDWCREAGFPKSLQPRSLVQEVFSIQRSVDVLLDYAKASGANLIALGTSARSGLKRALLGSFAESVALQSETPLLTVNPTTRDPDAIRQILFATDFSDAGRKALDKLLAVALAKGVKVTLFHKLEYIVPHTQKVIATYGPYREFMQQDVDEKRRRAQEWQDIGAKQGVEVDFVLDEHPNYVVDALLQAAEQLRDGMIAVASQRGRLTAPLLGSVTRDLIRRSVDPVWVIHPH